MFLSAPFLSAHAQSHWAFLTCPQSVRCSVLLCLFSARLFPISE